MTVEPASVRLLALFRNKEQFRNVMRNCSDQPETGRITVAEHSCEIKLEPWKIMETTL